MVEVELWRETGNKDTTGVKRSKPSKLVQKTGLVMLRPTMMGSENEKLNRLSFYRAEIRDQCRR